MLRLDTFIVAEFVSMLNFFYKKNAGEPIGHPNIYYRSFFHFINLLSLRWLQDDQNRSDTNGLG